MVGLIAAPKILAEVEVAPKLPIKTVVTHIPLAKLPESSIFEQSTVTSAAPMVGDIVIFPNGQHARIQKFENGLAIFRSLKNEPLLDTSTYITLGSAIQEKSILNVPTT